MKLILLAALFMQDESFSERVKRLAKDPKANHDELLRLGPAAIRTLLSVRAPGLEAVIDELRFAGTDHAATMQKPMTLKVKDLAAGSTLRLATGHHNLRLGIDSSLRDKFDRQISLDLADAPLGAILREIAAKLELEYGWVRGRIFFSTPERLWVAEPEPVRRLTVDQVASLEAAAPKLSDESLEVRDDAAKAILALGSGAIPHLEKLRDKGDAEFKGRIRDLIEKLAPAAGAPVFAEKMALESQELPADERGLLKGLPTELTFRVKDLPLSTTLNLLLQQADLKIDFAAGLADPKVTLGGENDAIIDTLYFLTLPYGLDAAFIDGKIRIDTREKIAESLKKK